MIIMNFLLIYIDIREGFTLSYTGSYSEGVASIISNLSRDGHSVHMLHITRKDQVTGEKIMHHVNKCQPDLIGFSVLSSNYLTAVRINNIIKNNSSVKTIIGGPHAMYSAVQIVMKDKFDFVAVGEGEVVLPRLLDHLADTNTGGGDLPGICLGNQPFPHSFPDCIVTDLDLLEPPDRSIFNFPGLRESKERQAYFISGRGCPFKCTHCPNEYRNKLFGTKKVRQKSPDVFIKEIVNTLNKYPFIEVLVFQDDILPINKKWFLEFAEKYRREVKLPFICNIHPKLISTEICSVLADTGCTSIMTGIESGSERIRREVIQRDISDSYLKEKIEICNRHHLGVSTYNMVGHFSESMEDALKTIKFNSELDLVRAICTIVIPYPGTALNRMCKEKNAFIRGEEPIEYPEITNEPVILNENISRSQVIFIKLYFNVLRRMYRRISYKALDRILLSRYFPFAVFNRIMIVFRPLFIFIYLNSIAKIYNRYDKRKKST